MSGCCSEAKQYWIPRPAGRPACSLHTLYLVRHRWHIIVSASRRNVPQWSRFIKEKKKDPEEGLSQLLVLGFYLFLFRSKFCSSSFWGAEDDGRWTTQWQSAPVTIDWTGFCFHARVWIPSEDLWRPSKLSLLLSSLWASAHGALLNPILSSNCWFSILCAHWKGSLNCLWVKKQKKKPTMCSKSFCWRRVIKKGRCT